MLSNRLMTIASSIQNVDIVADIGTDHAYLPIYLIQQGKANYVIASDVNKGPLEIAKAHIKEAVMGNKIETRLGSGLETIVPGEVDCIVIAGMGGLLMRDILYGKLDVAKSAQQLILQPQKDGIALRNSLYEQGFEIEREVILKEEGKFYEVLWANYTGCVTPYEMGKISRFLMKQSSEVMIEYVQKKIVESEKIIKELENQRSQCVASKKTNYQELINQQKEMLNEYKEVEQWQLQNVKGLLI